MPSPTTFTELLAAVVAKIKAVAPALKDVTAYERLSDRAAVPRAMVEVIEILPDDTGDNGSEQYAAKLTFSIYVLGDPRGETAAKLAIRALACELSAKLHRLHPGVPAGLIMVKGCYPDFVTAGGSNAQGRNASGFVEVQRIDCEVSALFLPSVWDWPAEEVELIFDDGEPGVVAPEL